jgi:hypothetical protein
LEEIVFVYLNRSYCVDKPLRLDWVLYKDSRERIDSGELIDELIAIFSLHKEVVIFLVKEWVHRFYPKVDLTDYFNYGLGGYIYVPYLVEEISLPISAGDFQPSQSVVSRYAQAEVNPNFYGIINPNSQIDFRA